MSVVFDGNRAGSFAGVHTLYGKPFPSEEIQALWHMTPVSITIFWVATGMFVLRRGAPPPFPDATYIEPVVTIGAENAHSYQAWVDAIQRLL